MRRFFGGIAHNVVSTLTPVRLPHARTLRKIWLVAVLLYAAARAVTVDYLLGDYGVNGLTYFAIEMLTSFPFARYSAFLVEDVVHDRRWFLNAAITAITYIAPDVYLLATIHSAPSRVYLWTLAVVALLSVISALALRRRVVKSVEQKN